jgi:phosphatidylinositol alpha 1,6-mannosyltransferase
MNAPRVALFADSFHEVNGAALTCRQLAAFAARKGYDFLTVCCGETDRIEMSSRPWRVEMRRGPMAIPIDRDLQFDPFLFRRRKSILPHIREFRPDIVHITSPGDIGILGAYTAHVTGAALVASWHTNLHEFGGRRLAQMLSWVPGGWKNSFAKLTEDFVLARVLWFFGRAQATLAPNEELRQLIHARTGKPCFPMSRGIDTELFSPARRSRTGGPFTIGYVGRLMPEKNVRFLAEMERDLLAAGAPPFQLLVVGDGSEASWLRANLRNATLPGILRGEALARAYADMDVFAFPSETDTFGNVVLEALASGVPAVVTAAGGPKFLVESGVTGFVAASPRAFTASVLSILRDGDLHARMKAAARPAALDRSWDRMFETQVYSAYRACLAREGATSIGDGRSDSALKPQRPVSELT